MVYVTAGGVLARSVCKLAGYDACDDVAAAVASALTIIFTAAADYSGGEAVSVPELPSPRRSFNSYQDMLVTAMEGHGLKFADIQPALPAEEAQKRSTEEPYLLERFLIKELLAADNTTTHDFYVNYYSNGGAVIHHPLLGADEHLTSPLAKRYSHPGFKVSYTMRRKSSLTGYKRDVMTTGIAGYWAGLVETTSMTDYIGFEEENGKANFYFRIIPEIRGFGTNYESVDICGGMASYL